MSKMIKFSFKKTNINNIHGLVILRPGVNEIPEDKWDKVKGTAQIQEWIKKGIILMISDAPVPEIKEPVKTAGDLISEIEKATDIGALEELKKDENRKTVLKAIKEQIKVLEKKAKKDNKSDEEKKKKEDQEKKEAAEQETIEKIKTVTDIEDLEKLKELEDSKDVIEAIDAQIKVLKDIDDKDK